MAWWLLSCGAGITLASHRGIHQFALPSISITAGTRTSLTTVASISTATASPSPTCFTPGSGVRQNYRNTTTTIAAAAVITRAVDASPDTTAAELSPDSR